MQPHIAKPEARPDHREDAMADEEFEVVVSTSQRGRPPKLSDDEIREIKLSTVLSNSELARLYRISEAHVSRIRSGAYVHSPQSQSEQNQ